MLCRVGSRIGWLLALGVLIGATGCVERRLVIVPSPHGAIVYDEKDQPIGAGPVDKPFVFYGKYKFRIAKDGYETLVLEQRVRAPWYELPGLDFISENLVPWTIRDVRYIYPVLQPAPVVSPKQIQDRGQQLRSYAATIGAPVETGPTILMPPVRP